MDHKEKQKLTFDLICKAAAGGQRGNGRNHGLL